MLLVEEAHPVDLSHILARADEEVPRARPRVVEKRSRPPHQQREKALLLFLDHYREKALDLVLDSVAVVGGYAQDLSKSRLDLGSLGPDPSSTDGFVHGDDRV